MSELPQASTVTPSTAGSALLQSGGKRGAGRGVRKLAARETGAGGGMQACAAGLETPEARRAGSAGGGEAGRLAAGGGQSAGRRVGRLARGRRERPWLHPYLSMPKNCSRPTISAAKTEIHMAATANPYTASRAAPAGAKWGWVGLGWGLGVGGWRPARQKGAELRCHPGCHGGACGGGWAGKQWQWR